jgi:hypothetical protein
MLLCFAIWGFPGGEYNYYCLPGCGVAVLSRIQGVTCQKPIRLGPTSVDTGALFSNATYALALKWNTPSPYCNSPRSSEIPKFRSILFDENIKHFKPSN